MRSSPSGWREGLSLPLSALSALRRQVLDQLGQARAALPERRRGEYHPGVRYENPREAPALDGVGPLRGAGHPGTAGPGARPPLSAL